jgi:hypothetical protein
MGEIGHETELAEDILYGAGAIASFLFGDAQQRGRVYYLSANGHLPVFRIGSRIAARKSTLREWVGEKERVAPAAKPDGTLRGNFDQ